MAFTQVIKTLGSVMASMKSAVDTWLSENITNPSNPPLDRSLSLSNACAPADMVGDIKNDVDNINGLLDMPFDETATGTTAYPNVTVIDNITLRPNIEFIVEAEAVTTGAFAYVRLKKSDGSTLISGNINSNNPSISFSYVSSELLTGCYIIMQITSVGDAGKDIQIHAYENISDKFTEIEKRLDDIDDITGYTKPNLISNKFPEQTYNGITYTVNSDRSVHAVGTATGSASFTNVGVTLPAGNYLLSGCAEGNSQTFHMAIILNGNFVYQYGGKDSAFTLTEETTLQVYCRVVGAITVDTTFYPMIRRADVYNSTYAPFGEYQIYKPIQKLIDYTQFNWSGKKMNVIGDSIVAGSYGNFIIPIRNILCLSEARNYGVGGSCLASSSADTQYPPAVLRYTSMDLDAQIIIVHAGTNDYSAQIPLGDSNSVDITTFNGALNVMMQGLRHMYPTALIIFDSILHRYNDGALTIPASAYRQAIEERCYANHIVFYDAYKYSGFDFVEGYYDHILTSDGLHPNQTGADILGRKLAGFIRWN